MKRKVVVGDMMTEQGGLVCDVGSGVCSGHVISAGAVVVAECGGQRQVVAAGVGRLEFEVGFPADGVLFVTAFVKTGDVSLFLDHWPAVGPSVGWSEGQSFAQLELKSRDAISPEVQAVLDRMQRNMKMMELKLLSQKAG